MRGLRPIGTLKQRGFGAVAAIMIVVILAVISAGLVKLGTTQQVNSAQDILSARAWQAARAGTEWGLYQALRAPPKVCDGTSPTLDLTATDGFRVTVTCTKTDFNEGELSPGVARSISIYTVTAVACNSAVSCPDAARADKPGYIERQRVVMACDATDPGNPANPNIRISCY
jgi:MSHA biogenesis protein MshP